MRGKQAKNRPIKPDFKFNSPMVAKFINYVMLDGKKSVAETNVYKALEKLSVNTKLKPIEAFDKALENIKPKIEVRSRRVGGANYQVPVPVAEGRQLTLALHWIINAARANRGGREFAESLAQELFLATKKEGTAFKKREDTHKMAEANKAFSHLGW
ncbi:MAG: 30S ribosomal protein S7 [bacterium]